MGLVNSVTINGVETALWRCGDDEMAVATENTKIVYPFDKLKRMEEGDVIAKLADKGVTVPMKLDAANVKEARVPGMVSVYPAKSGNFIVGLGLDNGTVRIMGMFPDKDVANSRAYGTALRLHVVNMEK